MFGAHTNMWKAKKFNFHTKSEHTIDGERYDLEMCTIHVADPVFDTAVPGNENKPNFKNAAVGILFSVKKYNVKLTKAE